MSYLRRQSKSKPEKSKVNIKQYKIPLDIIAFGIFKLIPYRDVDKYLSCFGLTSKEHAAVKFKIYKSRVKYSRTKNNVIECKVDGLYHCEEGPAVIHPDNICMDGDKVLWKRPGMTIWYKHGQIHNDNGPAIVSPLTEISAWIKTDLRHNTTGPALVFANPTGFLNCRYTANLREVSKKNKPEIYYEKELYYENGVIKNH
jgi:hypothetical protein